MVSFDVTDDQRELICKIAARADKEIFWLVDSEQDETATQMDLCAVIAQGVPMRLELLLAADKYNFAHDICGIYRCLNRSTGLLENNFFPRFAV